MHDDLGFAGPKGQVITVENFAGKFCEARRPYPPPVSRHDVGNRGSPEPFESSVMSQLSPVVTELSPLEVITKDSLPSEPRFV